MGGLTETCKTSQVLQAVDSRDSPRPTKKRKLDARDGGLRAEPAEESQSVSTVTNSELTGDVDPQSECDRAAHVIKTSLAKCMMTKRRLLAKCRSNVSAFREFQHC